ncbi:MAG: hypothetical protein IPG89_19180 [Bacteroidetes bacterium]|nr:hypothetical protein [Bacteroidota bacterium]
MNALRDVIPITQPGEKEKHMKPLIYKIKEMENKLIVKNDIKVPEDLLMDILRILFGNNIKHKIIGIQERQNIVLLNVNFDLNSLKNKK